MVGIKLLPPRSRKTHAIRYPCLYVKGGKFSSPSREQGTHAFGNLGGKDDGIEFSGFRVIQSHEQCRRVRQQHCYGAVKILRSTVLFGTFGLSPKRLQGSTLPTSLIRQRRA